MSDVDRMTTGRPPRASTTAARMVPSRFVRTFDHALADRLRAHSELRRVRWEHERERPVRDDPQAALPRNAKQINRAPQPPSDEAADVDAGDVDDRALAAEQRRRAERVVHERLGSLAVQDTPEIVRERRGLAMSVLRERRIRLAGLIRNGDRRVVAERPHIAVADTAHGDVGHDAAASIAFERKLRDERAHRETGRVDDGSGGDALAALQLELLRLDALHVRA